MNAYQKVPEDWVHKHRIRPFKDALICCKTPPTKEELFSAMLFGKPVEFTEFGNDNDAEGLNVFSDIRIKGYLYREHYYVTTESEPIHWLP